MCVLFAISDHLIHFKTFVMHDMSLSVLWLVNSSSCGRRPIRASSLWDVQYAVITFSTNSTWHDVTPCWLSVTQGGMLLISDPGLWLAADHGDRMFGRVTIYFSAAMNLSPLTRNSLYVCEKQAQRDWTLKKMGYVWGEDSLCRKMRRCILICGLIRAVLFLQCHIQVSSA